MKFYALLICIVAFSFSARAQQLANTSWAGTLNMPSPTQVLLTFSKDTLNVVVLPDSSVVESMKYKIDNKQLFITKMGGMSPCDMTSVGKYNLEMKNEMLYITAVDDPCTERVSAFIEGFKKVK